MVRTWFFFPFFNIICTFKLHLIFLIWKKKEHGRKKNPLCILNGFLSKSPCVAIFLLGQFLSTADILGRIILHCDGVESSKGVNSIPPPARHRQQISPSCADQGVCRPGLGSSEWNHSWVRTTGQAKPSVALHFLFWCSMPHPHTTSVFSEDSCLHFLMLVLRCTTWGGMVIIPVPRCGNWGSEEPGSLCQALQLSRARMWSWPGPSGSWC